MSDTSEDVDVDLTAPEEPGAPVGDLRQRHRLRNGLAIVVLLLLVASVGIAVRWSSTGARPVSLDEARERLASETSLPTGDPEVLRPAQGLYLYRGHGTDKIDKPPKEQAQGPDMPATVTHRPDGCWTLRIDYSSNHWQSWGYCPTEDGGLDEVDGQVWSRWDFVAFQNESTTDYTCPSSPTITAGQQPGDSWDQECHGSGGPSNEASTTKSHFTYVGLEQLEIGGTTVEAHHYRRESTMTGGERGDESGSVWFSAETGLPLRSERSLELRTSSVIGDVLYTEANRYELTSLDPEA